MNSDGESLGCLREQFQEVEAVGVAAVNGFPFITAGSNVETTARPLDAQWPCHATNRSAAGSKSQFQL
jgi:hypothetical protein